MLMFDLLGAALSEEEKELLLHPLVGGIILFTRNYETRSQLRFLIQSIKKIRPSLLIAIDHEGGRVQRFQNEFTRLPPVAEINLATAEQWGYTMAHELIAMGVDLSFAPSLDINYGINEVITGNRSFNRDPEKVSQLAEKYINGMNKAGMLATGKHFPGHGGASADSHVAMPKDTRDFATIEQNDLIPYIKLKSLLAGVMAAHVIYPAIDPNPAGFSHFWLQTVLRERLHFTGAIFSDCLNMAAAAVVGDHVMRVEAALTAGCDMALLCNNRPALLKVLSQLKWQLSLLSQQRLLKFGVNHAKL